MDSTTYNDEVVVRSEFPLLVAVVYLPRIQILVVGGYRGSPPNAHLLRQGLSETPPEKRSLRISLMHIPIFP
jgi:hypothetical protein